MNTLPGSAGRKPLCRKNDGYVMQLQNFSVNDGEGIRTTIFLCGCPLKCIWCCNPENQYYFDEEHHMTLAEIDAKISRQALFYRKCGGGLTFSGGEATMQQAFLRSLTENFYDKGYSLSLETCGCFSFPEIKDILSKMDLIFYDLKLMSPELHRLFTGESNGLILENLKQTASLSIPLVVRIPVITGVNAYLENIRQTCAFLQRYAPTARLELLPYHRFGTDKYTSLALPSPDERYQALKKSCSGQLFAEGFFFAEQMEIPSDQTLALYKKTAAEYGIQTITYR